MASSAQENKSSTHENGTDNSKGDMSITDIDTLKNECLKWKTKSEKLQTELDDTKSEVTVANCIKESMIELERQKRGLDSEMATMQQLLTESHDEVNKQKTQYEHEMARLRAVMDQMERENREMRIQKELSERNPENVANSISVDKDTLLGGAAALKDVTSNFARNLKSNIKSVIPQQGSSSTSPMSALNVPQEKPMSPSSEYEGNDDSHVSSPSIESKPSPTSTMIAADSQISSDMSLDHGMRKAYEDTELLRSIVVPLEEQITALKDKLRETDYHLNESEKRQTKLVLGVEALVQWLDGKSYEEASMLLDARQKELLSFSELKERETDECDTNYTTGETNSSKESFSCEITKNDSRIFISLLFTRIAFLQKELQSTKNEFSYQSNLYNNARKVNAELENQVKDSNSEIMRLQKNHLSEINRLSSVLSEDQKCRVSMLKTSDNNEQIKQKESKYSMNNEANEVITVQKEDWTNLQSELAKVRAVLGVGDSDNLIGGEKFRELQQRLIEIKEECEVHAKQEEKLTEELAKESEFRQKVESEWNERAEQHRNEVEQLNSQLQKTETVFEQLRLSYQTLYQSTQKDLKALSSDREKIVREIKRLQDENDNLTGKYSSKADEMQNEVIDLPKKLEDIHLLLLRYREDLITTKVAKERLEEKLKSEVSFLKAQISGEQQAKEDIEDQLTTEVDQLKEKIYLLESCKSELEAEQKRGKEYEENQLKHQKTHANLQSEMKAHVFEKHELENKVAEMNAKIKNLQQELDDSVAVQTDFVRLSQSLQIELEKIRQGEKEVRWQHEDDIPDCQGCRKSFAHNPSSKRKHHCRHCGRIFCIDCLSKSVPGGPKGRPSRVCDVCHTLLVQNSAPYFSTDAPQLAN